MSVNRLDKISFLTPDEGRILLDATQKKSLRHHALFLVALRTGMRQGEIIGLQWGDIDWNGKFIEIRRTNWKGHMTTPKSGKARRCDMSDQLGDVLQDHKRRVAAEALAKGRPLPSWVFPSDTGTMLDASNIRKVFDACITHAGLRRIRFHDLRHSLSKRVKLGRQTPIPQTPFFTLEKAVVCTGFAIHAAFTQATRPPRVTSSRHL